MKNIFKIIIVVLSISMLPLFGISNNSRLKGDSKPIITKILENEGIENYRIPAFIIRFALKNSDESDEITPFLNGCRYINLAICENDVKNYKESYSLICKRLSESSYVNLVDINDGESKISIMSLFERDIISELVILIVDDEEFVSLSMTGKIDPKEISKVIAELNKSKSTNN